MAKNSKALSLPDHVVGLLAEADKRNGFPAGTMFSVMQQEIGGQDRFLKDPSAYHYEPNAQGQRIAGHTGKISTAFGPFGILESTGRDPGYGVTPLKDKSIEEQVRFSSDYLAARSRHGGGLTAGLAGYGEGAQYANQVQGRLSGGTAQAVAAAPAEPVAPVTPQGRVPTAVQIPEAVQLAQVPAPNQAEMAPDEWAAWNEQYRQRQAPVQVADLAYGNQAAPQVQNPVAAPDFMGMLGRAGQNLRPDFRAFAGLKGWV